jgi:hypothetical protein
VNISTIQVHEYYKTQQKTEDTEENTENTEENKMNILPGNEQNYNFACGLTWVWNLFSDIKGGTQTEGV